MFYVPYVSSKWGLVGYDTRSAFRCTSSPTRIKIRRGPERIIFLIRILYEHKCALIFTLVADDLTNRCWVLTKTHSLFCLVGVTLPATPAVLSHKGTIIGSIFESKSQLLSPYKKALITFASKTATLLLVIDF